MPHQTDRPTDRKTIQHWPELLVPFDGSQGAEKVLRRACRAARRDGVDLTVLCMVKLATDDAEDWGNPDLNDTALLALTRAQVICRTEGVVGVFELNHARDLAKAIVQEARRGGAGLICLSLDEHELGETALMSETVQAVLASAPCSVLLDDPASELLPPELSLPPSDRQN